MASGQDQTNRESKGRFSPIAADQPIWDMTLPGMPSGLNDAGTLSRFHELGYRYVSVTVANDTCHDSELAAAFIRNIEGIVDANAAHFRLVKSSNDISNAVADGQLAISVHFQGTNPFGGDIENVARFADLGLDHALLAYNEPNAAADGCANFPGAGLSRFGRALIREFNRCGVIVDGSHSGYRSTMEAMELSTSPVIFSHANAHAVFPHYRNLRDDQIKACAATGGVIGINGVGAFLNADGDASAERIFRHIDYLAELVGHRHIGVAWDFIERIDVFAERAASEASKWPLNDGKPVVFREFAGPEVVFDVAALMAARGYEPSQIRDISWGNFHRVYSEVVG